MKNTKEQAAENRRGLVETAARLFREKGMDGVGVAEISKAAGLTHGGQQLDDVGPGLLFGQRSHLRPVNSTKWGEILAKPRR